MTMRVVPVISIAAVVEHAVRTMLFTDVKAGRIKTHATQPIHPAVHVATLKRAADVMAQFFLNAMGTLENVFGV